MNYTHAVNSVGGAGRQVQHAAPCAPRSSRRPFEHFVEICRATGRLVDCLDRLKDRLADPVAHRIVRGAAAHADMGGNDLGRLLGLGLQAGLWTCARRPAGLALAFAGGASAALGDDSGEWAVDAVGIVEGEVRELIRRRGVDPTREPDGVRRLVEGAVADYDDRSLSGGLPPLQDPGGTVKWLLDSVVGLGPLQRYLDDPRVEELWVNVRLTQWLGAQAHRRPGSTVVLAGLT